jgi:hypothetical protein
LGGLGKTTGIASVSDPPLIAALVVVGLGIPGIVAFEVVQRKHGPTFTVSGRRRWLLFGYLAAFTTSVIVMMALMVVYAVT